MKLIHSGKVRDVYADGYELILVASDRVSVFDTVLPTPIPDKGKLLTALSHWWFEQLADLVPNHIVSTTEVPPKFAGRAVRVKKLQMIGAECIARGYLTGSGLKEYQEVGSVSGIKLPAGLVEASQLDSPLFTPSSKAEVGDHDVPISFSDLSTKFGAELAEKLRDLTLAIYGRGFELAAKRGIIIADTKFEFGLDADGTVVLGDEVLTSDSSRFWDAAAWQPGVKQESFDKQPVRDWAKSTGWAGEEPGPEIPDEIVELTRAKYIEAYERITEQRWT